MNTKRFLKKSIFLYKSFYRLIAIAVIVAIAVIIGSLTIGDSVRGTLIKRVEERLGKTETIIFSKYSYITPPKESETLNINDAGLLLNGFLSLSGKLIPVTVWGMDKFEVKKGEVRINSALYNEIKNSVQSKDIVLRLPNAGMTPLGSMYVTDSYTTSLRLELDSVISVEKGGNLNLKNEQTIPFNIFVNREELAETMDITGKINLILSENIISKDEFATLWNYEMAGLNVKQDSQFITIKSDRIFIQEKVVETLCKTDTAANRFYTYLANSICGNNNSIPYSFVTAVDFYDSMPVNPNEIIVSDYVADRLNIGINDTVSISYFVSKQFKTLIEDSVFLTVGKIVPIEDFHSNNDLKADFPGLSNVDSCTDWDSDLPVNMNLITNKDEEFWEIYKNCPKVIVPYSVIAPLWENVFGSATALNISYNSHKLNDLTYEMFDIQLLYPREDGIIAAKSGVDFASLFLSLGFFIVISAALLMLVPLSEMLFRRKDEINLLKAVGFSEKRIFKLFWNESAPVICFSAIAGIVAGILYTYVVLFFLGTVWKGATHTENFKLIPNLITMAAGMTVAIVLALLMLYIYLGRSLKSVTQNQIVVKSHKQFFIRQLRVNSATITTIIFTSLLIINLLILKSALLFVCVGVLFLVSCWLWINYLIDKGIDSKISFGMFKMMWASLFYRKKQTMLAFITLASGVFIVFSVGLNRQGFADSTQIRTATGGFSLWCETTIPIFHNIQTEDGRNKLALRSLPPETKVIQLLKYSADDASCLNLNKVVTPNVLGIDIDQLKISDFKIVNTIFDNREKNILDNFKVVANSHYPALIDETVLTWSLGKKLGDTIIYESEKGKTISIILAGTLQNSIFQGHIVIDKTLFSEIWSEISGSEIMLLSLPDSEIAETKTLLTQALNNYGIRVMTTNERMKMFNSVTDTYLTIFLTLGGLGLLLGIFSFIIVVRKNLTARNKEINLYRSLGFMEIKIKNILFKENIIIPLFAIITGFLGSLTSISLGFGNISAGIWGVLILFLSTFILSVMIFVKSLVKKYLKIRIS
ncbi:MAG: ABC transporter permease [Marinilabiliaceae bacterium]|nr:ABC transporter permease [Marinilabiliaceae bacterium]